MDISAKLEDILRLTPRQKNALKKLNILTAEDLLRHFPFRYEDPAAFKKIADLADGDEARVWGKITTIDFQKTWKKKLNIAYGTIQDETGSLGVVWFRQPYIARMLPEGSCAIFSGKVASKGGKLYIANPLYEIVPPSFVPEFSARMPGRLLPLYSTAAGISSLWLQKNIERIISRVKIFDSIPKELLERYHLPGRAVAYRAIHAPKTLAHAIAARKHFAFEEVFFIQLARLFQKEQIMNALCAHLSRIDELQNAYIAELPFTPTAAQLRATKDISRDFQKGTPMNRLLEGDVGSGKTAVAACAAYIIAKNRMQAVYMAPTEILARQHFEGFCQTLGKSGIKIGLLTSSLCEKFPSKINNQLATHVSRAQLLKWICEGEFPILIGTHALIEKRVVFKNLALAMVDEQHRFGVLQRSKLLRKGAYVPHFLTMTATPIPRTLALTLYADLDVSLIDELPQGRKQIETKIVSPSGRVAVYEFIREKLSKGEQAFVICPRIDPGDATKVKNQAFLDMKSVKEEYKKLKSEIFPEFSVGMMHGKLTTTEKEKTMDEFRRGVIQILVSTSVVEVGVDVPNATIMMIEGVERFGLAQLHQFRGRVGRSDKQSFCFIFEAKASAETRKRLKALMQAKNGFELAEYDLKFRGSGELAGGKQWGFSDIGMEALKNLKLVEAARKEAKYIIENKLIGRYPLLEKIIQEKTRTPIHFE